MSMFASTGQLQVPLGRDIPSLHTEDIYGARPKQNTMNRNIWQDQFVQQQIHNQPLKKERHENLNKQLRSPMFADFNYKKVDLNQPTKKYEPPEVYRGDILPQKLAALEKSQKPAQVHNDSLQKFMIQQGEISNKARDTKSQRIQNSFINHEKEYGRNKSPLVMHIDPGKTMQRSQPFANFQTGNADDSKELLRGETSFYSQRFQSSGYGGLPGYKSRPNDPNNNQYRQLTAQRQMTNGLQEQQSKYKQFLSQSQVAPYSSQNIVKTENDAPKASFNSHNTSIIQQNQQQPQQPAPQQNSNNQQQQQQQPRTESRQSRQSLNRIQVKNIINDNRKDITQGVQSQRNLEHNQQNYQTAPQVAMTPQHQQHNNSAFFGQNGSQTAQIAQAKKTYKPYNVVTHKRHQQYDPKFGVSSNHWDCYDKPKWSEYVAKKEAPKNIFQEKNRNNIDTHDFTTSNVEYGQFKQKYRV